MKFYNIGCCFLKIIFKNKVKNIIIFKRGIEVAFSIFFFNERKLWGNEKNLKYIYNKKMNKVKYKYPRLISLCTVFFDHPYIPYFSSDVCTVWSVELLTRKLRNYI